MEKIKEKTVIARIMETVDDLDKDELVNLYNSIRADALTIEEIEWENG